MNFKYMHPADQLVEIMNRIYQRGLTTTSGGNLSVRDENAISGSRHPASIRAI